MELHYKTPPEHQTVTKKPLSVRTLLNSIGLFLFGGLWVQGISIPITFTKSGGFSHIEKMTMKTGDLLEYSLFIFVCGLLYTFLVNSYFMGEKWRKLCFFSLTLMGCISMFMVFYLILHPPSH
ncbi:hypothetical protein HF072_04835 [Bacillus sp. RO3]|nr:hypothetical protein [Bacillus sp. RO3]